MKIGRNDPCPCGSGKKYKYCCMNKPKMYIKDGASITEAIRNIVKQQGYNSDIADILCNLMRYMEEKRWMGACHATSSVIYVALSELGYNPTVCIGEAKDDVMGFFDHSWIVLDGKIIDLACAITLVGGRPVCAPVIFDVDSYTGKRYEINYGIYYSGLDQVANYILSIPFTDYLDSYPNEKEGLWKVVECVLGKKIDVPSLRVKYKNTQWKYVHPEEVQ
mgnify:FL=1